MRLAIKINRDTVWAVLKISAVFFIGGVLGWWLARYEFYGDKGYKTPTALRAYSIPHKFVNPLIAVGDNEELHMRGPLELEIKRSISSYKSTSEIGDISVYLRDLNSGRWWGVNENYQYSPASLYKVALMIAYLKQAESDPGVFSRQIIYEAGNYPISISEATSSIPLEIGKVYSVPELIQKMIVQSNNDAAELLLTTVDKRVLKGLFEDLNLPLPEYSNTGDTMSPKSYSLFFRILYNATYLGDVMSEKALELLSKTEFNYGLAAELPRDTAVAHKFGHRIEYSTSGKVNWEELHDCGIVYLPHNPYLICIMSRGHNFDELASAIQGVSKLIFEAMKSSSAVFSPQ